jgi:uncharacterized protein (DUF885 family)
MIKWQMPETIDSLLDQFVADELDENPVMASALGAEGYDDRVGDLSAQGFDRRAANEDRWLERFRGQRDDGLTPAQRIDRDYVIAALRGRAAMRDWASWRRNPDVYLNPILQGVFVLFLHRLAPEAELADSAASRMRAAPELVERAKANLDPDLAHPLLVERALGQCRAAIRYGRDLVATEVDDPAARARLAEAGATAATAFEDLARFLDDFQTTARGAFAIGEARYTATLQQRELLDVDTAALHAMGEAQWQDLAGEMTRLAELVDGPGHHDWRDTVARLNADHPASPDEMRAAYQRWTEQARQFLVDHQLVTLPEGEECSVEPSPHFQRPVLAVASYMLPPPLRPSKQGHFFVPYPPDGTPPEEVQKRLESNCHHEIPTVSVHEAYPGHHWHLVASRDSGRPVRNLLRSPYFAEGWALYAELMMREQGFFTDPRQELMHVKDRLFRAARIVVDTALHTGEMTPEQATTFMMERAGLPEPTARVEVARYCATPTQASAYLTGSLAIERVRRRWFDEGRGDLRAFHDGIARLGCMPVALHERGLF